MEKYKAEDFNINKLGTFYEIDKTAFYCFSPASEKLFLVLDGTKYEMNKVGYNYSLILNGNYHLHKYHYEKANGETFLDPFAYYSDQYDSYILDPRRFYSKKNQANKITEPIIYELNVRDFSSHKSYPGEFKGKFLALSESGLTINKYPVGLDYIRNLGVNVIQLLPINHFDLDHSEYNWGYNPRAYNYLYKGYIQDDFDPYAYINEFAYTVDVLHACKLNVTMDVVFNHVYKYDEFDLYKMIGPSVFRFKEDGKLAAGSLCGNELKSEDPFVRAYLLKMLQRYVELFDVDGFRFDLMGILDYESINFFKDELAYLKKDLLIYGEGWNMGDVLPIEKRASILNAEKMKNVFFFNDYFRDNIIEYLKDDTFAQEIIGDCLMANNVLNDSQSLNYLECHDNMTLYDQMKKYFGDDGPLKSKCLFGLALILFSKGIPFIHAGQEFAATKKMCENSYNAGDLFNSIDWQRSLNNKDMVLACQKMIQLRKKYQIGSNDTKMSCSDFYGCLVCDMSGLRIVFNPTSYDYNYHTENKMELVYDGKYCCLKPDFNFVVPRLSIIVLVDLI